MAAAAGRRAYAGGGPRIGETGKFEGEFKVQENAPYIKHRLDVWDKLYKKHQEELAKKPRSPIKIELPDGKVKDGKTFETTPLEIAQGISKGLADSVVVAKVLYKEAVASLKQCVAADAESDDEPEENGAAQGAVLWDLTRPLEGSCRLELLKFDDPQGQDVFWHSSAHILGQAMERAYGCHLTIGPALESGFYYDGFFGDRKMKAEDFAAIEKHAMAVCKEQQAFERCVLTKEEALELFSENPFKVQLITNKVPDGSMTSCYRCGPLIDLCRGPHIPNTGKAKAFKVTKNSAAYWLGDQSLDSLQRLYGMAFPSEKQMKEYQKFLEEAAKRDHRNLGKQMELFMLHAWASPGSCFWFPAGAKIYNKLIDFMRSEYRLRGFTEVVTPNMYSAALFKQSGHYQNYKDDMYSLDIEKQEWMLKPMNCPGHFLMFDARIRSYKELPIRYADFGVLHRNEDSGALSGLTRVRRFQQDDAHIFVRPDQIKAEVAAALDFLNYIYKIFGFSATFALSTRPKKALGSKEIWDNAESQLKAALDESGKAWSLNAGDGAFYGPKIDIRLKDAMGRRFQCGTIQLDFNNPIRFNLQYRKEGAEEDAPAEEEDKTEFQGAVETKAHSTPALMQRQLRARQLAVACTVGALVAPGCVGYGGDDLKTATTHFPVDSPCMPGKDVAKCVDYLNEQYMGYDPANETSPLGVAIRGQPRFNDPWFFCTQQCYRGQPDCYTAASLLNHMVMLHKDSRTVAMPMNYPVGIVFQPKAIAHHLTKCAWQFDGAAFNRMNGGCGPGRSGHDCRRPGTAFENVCPSTGKPADRPHECPEIYKQSCDAKPHTRYPGLCYWRGPAFYSSSTPGVPANLTEGPNEIHKMLLQRMGDQSGTTGDHIPLLQYWNELTMDGKILQIMMKDNLPAAIAAVMYKKGSHQGRGWAQKYSLAMERDYGFRVPLVELDMQMPIVRGSRGPFSAPAELETVVV